MEPQAVPHFFLHWAILEGGEHLHLTAGEMTKRTRKLIALLFGALVPAFKASNMLVLTFGYLAATDVSKRVRIFQLTVGCWQNMIDSFAQPVSGMYVFVSCRDQQFPAPFTMHRAPPSQRAQGLAQ